MSREVTEESTFSEVLSFTQESIDSPQRVSADGIDVTNRPARDIIDLARYRRSSALLGLGFGALTIQQFKPPNALGSHSR